MPSGQCVKHYTVNILGIQDKSTFITALSTLIDIHRQQSLHFTKIKSTRSDVVDKNDICENLLGFY